MPKFRVAVRRTEIIHFELEAASAEEADENHLESGEETFSKSKEYTVIDIEEIAP